MPFFTWLFTSCEAAWRRHARFLVLGWLAGAALCLYAGWAGEGLYYYLDYMWNGRPNAGLMTLVSGYCLVACGWGFAVAARRAWREPNGASEALGFTLGSLGCIVLAFDEVAQMHERLAHFLVRHHVPKPFGIFDVDSYIFLLYLGGLIHVLVLLWPTRRPLEPAMLPLLVAIACMGLSEVLDQIPWEWMSHETQQIVGAFEEGYKVFGSWTLAMAGLLVADEGTRQVNRSPAARAATAED